LPLPELDQYPRRRSIWPMLLLFLVALLIGMGVMAWLFARYDVVADYIAPKPPTIVAPKPASPPPVIRIAAPPSSDVVGAVVDQRIDSLEEKVDRIDERAQAATGEASRAEGLLVAFAARRSIDRGVPLGYLEGILRDRFGGVEPQAVAMVISGSRTPVTIDQLRDQLDALSPKLTGASADEGWWDGFRRELGGLIVIRKADLPSAAPVDRLARARDNLAAGQVDAALAEVARLPARTAAQGWIVAARRYVQTRAALDRIETAALLRPATPVVLAAEPVTAK
jgi:outer membrane murein-binding lipoprotein Lpp